MAITEDEVRKIAKLSRLALTSEEAGLYRGQLVKILDSMAELSHADTSQVPPTASMGAEGEALREDEPAPFADPEAIVALAPEREGPYFKVKKVIES